MRSKLSKKRKAPSRKRKAPSAPLLAVAVVLKAYSYNPEHPEDSVLRSGRSQGDWGSFVGANKEEVVAAALKARALWERSGAYWPYRIMTGTLTEEIITPTNYRVVKIKRSTLRAGE